MKGIPILAALGSWFALIGIIWTLFERANKSIRPEARDQVAQWLTSLNVSTKSNNWAELFLKIFDSVFGERHLTIRCFLRSSFVSLSAVVVCILIWISTSFSHIRQLINEYDSQSSSVFHTTMLESLIYALIFIFSVNLLADYTSLLKSRYLIRKMINKKSIIKRIVLFLYDILLTLLIFTLMVTFFSPVAYSISHYGTIDIFIFHSGDGLLDLLTTGFIGAFEEVESGITFYSHTQEGSFPDIPNSIYLYSSLFTTIWSLLFLISSIILTGMNKIGNVLDLLKRKILDIENKPLESLAMVGMLFITIIYMSIGLVSILS